MLLAGAAGCEGAITDPRAGGARPPSGMWTPTSPSDPTSSSWNPSAPPVASNPMDPSNPTVPTDPSMPPPMCTESHLPLPSVLHRLNRVEYNNTVRDLLGDTTAPANAFPADNTSFGFANNAAVLTVAPALFEKYEAAAEKLVADAWTRDATAQVKVLKLCAPGNGADTCTKNIISDFARRAWRRPLAAGEVDRFVALVQVAISDGDTVEAGIKLALQGVLLSPRFLFRVELDTATTAHPLTDHELASRLSYFLWSSMPDAQLMQLADNHTLHTPATLEAQIRRMLNDPRARALTDNFAGQWLGIETVPELAPDPTLFPLVTPSLKNAMAAESSNFFSSWLTENRDLRELLVSDFTFVNADLAKHYGLPAVTGAGMQRVQLPNTQRGGLLTQAGILALTSQPNRTSPTRRGAMVLATLMCAAPPPPPPNVEALAPPVNPTDTLRQQLEAHRKVAVCASCHNLMDPLGFGLENYDAVGAWRTLDRGAPIDSTGALPDGSKFNGARELSLLLKNDPRFPNCMAEKLFTYAMGRGVRPEDRCALSHLSDAVVSSGGHLADLVLELARSETFTSRQPLTGVTP